MKTERFASIVQAAGNPVAHLLLISPEKDKVLQTAIKTNRVTDGASEPNRKQGGLWDHRL